MTTSVNRHLQLDVVGTSAPGQGVPGLGSAGLGGLEPLYEPADIAAYLHLDASTVRRLFIDQPGVLKLGRPAARGGKRSYTTLRIPASVVRRFLAEHSGRVGGWRQTVAQPGGVQRRAA